MLNTHIWIVINDYKSYIIMPQLHLHNVTKKKNEKKKKRLTLKALLEVK